MNKQNIRLDLISLDAGTQHKAEHAAWVKKERTRQITALLAASSPADREAIKRGQRAGRKLRREVERL